MPLPVSHAFHTTIVAPASEPLRRTLERLRLQPPSLPIVANVNGEFYPMGPGVVPQMLDILAQQVASPVQFVKGLQTLYDAGARVFVEVGPKKALQGFVDDVLGDRSRRRRRCSPTIRSSATSCRSTRRCAACTRPGSASDGDVAVRARDGLAARRRRQTGCQRSPP